MSAMFHADNLVEEFKFMNALRTFIYKSGDKDAAIQIESILNDGWKISCNTPNGSINITTFSREHIPASGKFLSCARKKSIVK